MTEVWTLAHNKERQNKNSKQGNSTIKMLRVIGLLPLLVVLTACQPIYNRMVNPYRMGHPLAGRAHWGSPINNNPWVNSQLISDMEERNQQIQSDLQGHIDQVMSDRQSQRDQFLSDIRGSNNRWSLW
ncbi:uncharacterized protein LOC117334768 [Pecten maximus]|uniref:uncharacterized protein LOC117334768 n=1 Tax=Pecten maximus TaxID=6579 RepID=UPI0014582C92|nr:uncharacterized protein LOC117334768 [Pecten maximus]